MSIFGENTEELSGPVSDEPDACALEWPEGFEQFEAADELWEICPGARQALVCADFELSRKQFYEFLLKLEVEFDKPVEDIPQLERLIVLKSLRVFKHLIRTRNERKAGGYSTLKFLLALACRGPADVLEQIGPGFIEEMKHLFLGLMGKCRIYRDDAGEGMFSKLTGREAALERSRNLDRLALTAEVRISRFKTGLEPEMVGKRKENAERIRKYLDASEDDWNDWKWHLRNVIRTKETLADLIELSTEEREAVELTLGNDIPFGITPYYVSLMNHETGSTDDLAIRAQVIPGLAYVKGMVSYKQGRTQADFMGESDTSPIDLVTRRYPNIVILKPFNTCAQICVYCQRNWEVRQVLDPKAEASKAKIQEAINWISATPSITEVLITGGDPGIMNDTGLERVLEKVAEISHVNRIRVGTRTPVVLPQRITSGFRDVLTKFHEPGKREICLVTHFEHVSEVTPEAMDAVQMLKSSGISIYNQLVFTTFNSRRFEAVALRKALRLIGVDPYYTFNAKGKEETIDFRVPIARLQMEYKEEARLLPGMVRTDAVVFNVPRLGKNYLQHGQDNRVIGIKPDGSRIYEFLPWEKNISLRESYVHEDVPILDYLCKLEELGEDISEYDNIWYYY